VKERSISFIGSLLVMARKALDSNSNLGEVLRAFREDSAAQSTWGVQIRAVIDADRQPRDELAA
jgi:ABC-type branched-subunit amino acid transport system permease subunit